jgi:hypothetical protein
MATRVELAAGVFGVVAGLLWIIKPITMQNIQRRILFFGPGEADSDDEQRDALIGRISGALLVLLGLYLVFVV